MIYFFHHYELPAILQQIRIQEMLLQNQQAGQGNQTTLQDNLNNNTTSSNATGGVAGGRGAPNGQPQPPGEIPPHPNGLANRGTGGGAGNLSDLDWVAETAAIITEALSAPQLRGSLQETEGIADLEEPPNGSINVVAILQGGNEDTNTAVAAASLVTVEITARGNGQDSSAAPQLLNGTSFQEPHTEGTRAGGSNELVDFSGTDGVRQPPIAEAASKEQKEYDWDAKTEPEAASTTAAITSSEQPTPS